MSFLGRLIVAILVLGAIPFHGLIPGLQLLGLVDQTRFEMFAGADPLVTAFIDAGTWPAVLLGASTVCLVGALIGVLKGERWAASLVLLTAVADAIAVYLAGNSDFVILPLSILQIIGLGAAMVVLFLLVRGVTKPV